MVKKCCVYGCSTNYLSQKKNSNDSKTSVYRFPRDEEERTRWIRCIPNENLKVSSNTVVCELHWPINFEKIKVKGRERPKNPPSIWPNVPLSQIPTSIPSIRSTKRASSSSRNNFDEIDLFLAKDNFDFDVFCDTLLNKKRNFSVEFIAFISDSKLYVQSTHFNYATPKFLIIFDSSLKFESYFNSVKKRIHTVSNIVNTWSKFKEVLRYLNLLTPNNKEIVMNEQVNSMNTSKYSLSVIIRAFEYFATSRTLYKKLRDDFKLPSIRTLTRITSRVSKSDDNLFLKQVFDNLSDSQRTCIILHDEVYVKKMLLYHGGAVFGKALDDPDSLAKTVLGVMITCMFGGPKFLVKMLPVNKLNSQFLYGQIQSTVEAVKDSNGEAKAIICDGNRTNQAFFKRFDTFPERPWLTTNGTFLLFDFVHLIKNIRNNWLTEKTGELVFYENGVEKKACWKHLIKLYEAESNCLMKLSDLNEVSIRPSHIEKQSVSTCLKVFSDKTYNALLNHPETTNISNISETADFIKLVVTWWKILNVKNVDVDCRFNDNRQAVIRDPNDDRLKFVFDFGEMALRMTSKQRKRIKQLTHDTGHSINHTCKGIVELTKTLLKETHKYVLLGKFTTDPLEKEFSKLRQGSGGTYFLSVQQIIEKFNISKASLLLTYNINDSASYAGHSCQFCGFFLDESSAEVFDNLPTLEKSITVQSKMSLVYIAGYVSRNDDLPNEEELLTKTMFYFEKFGQYLKSVDRGGLKIPFDNTVQWVLFSFVLFISIKDKVCRTSLCNIFMLISEHYSFDMERHHGNILSNIFIKNYCKLSTPKSNKEPSLKILKLSC